MRDAGRVGGRQTPSILPDDIWTSPEPPKPGEPFESTAGSAKWDHVTRAELRSDSSSHHIIPRPPSQTGSARPFTWLGAALLHG